MQGHVQALQVRNPNRSSRAPTVRSFAPRVMGPSPPTLTSRPASATVAEYGRKNGKAC